MHRTPKVIVSWAPRPSTAPVCAADILPWSLLDAEARHIVKQFVSSWQKLLRDKDLTEHDYHKFIRDQPAFFFLQRYQVVSKPDLGSDYQPDFVVACDQGSYGIHYRFIELETPHALAYNASGNPSARLTHAMQQVLNWKTWIRSNRRQYKKLFPSKYFAAQEFDNLSFCIYIGRRDQSPRLTALRNGIAKEVGIEIRSFDALIDRVEELSFLDVAAHSGQIRDLDIVVRNKLVNPFSKAYSWQAWKGMVLDGEFSPVHFSANNVATLLKHRSYNSNLRRFKRIWTDLSEAKKKVYISRILSSCR